MQNDCNSRTPILSRKFCCVCTNQRSLVMIICNLTAVPIVYLNIKTTVWKTMKLLLKYSSWYLILLTDVYDTLFVSLVCLSFFYQILYEIVGIFSSIIFALNYVKENQQSVNIYSKRKSSSCKVYS